MRGTRIAAILAGLLLFQFVAGVGFRAFIYADMYIAPDAPYGISDLIELVLGWALLATAVIALVAAVTIATKGPKINRVAAGLLVALLLVLAVLLDPAHIAAAKWSARHDRKSVLSEPSHCVSGLAAAAVAASRSVVTTAVKARSDA